MTWLAKWNPIRDVWEVETQDLFSEHLDVFSETWPISGSMRNGEAFRPPMLERLTSGCGYSSSLGIETASGAQGTHRKMFRTPCASELDGGALTPEQAKERGQTLRLAGQVEAEFGDLRTLPTPTTSDGNGAGLHGDGAADLRTTAATLPATDFGDYTAAVQRWEAATGRPAPAPTKPNPKTGKQQLSAEFVEWMMGLPAGWFTNPEIGLSRPQQFRIAGNGVVPQQGDAALATMLDTALAKEVT